MEYVQGWNYRVRKFEREQETQTMLQAKTLFSPIHVLIDPRRAVRLPCFEFLMAESCSESSSRFTKGPGRELRISRDILHGIVIKTRCFFGSFPCFFQIVLLLVLWQVFEFRMGHNLIQTSIDLLSVMRGQVLIAIQMEPIIGMMFCNLLLKCGNAFLTAGAAHGAQVTSSSTNLTFYFRRENKSRGLEPKDSHPGFIAIVLCHG